LEGNDLQFERSGPLTQKIGLLFDIELACPRSQAFILVIGFGVVEIIRLAFIQHLDFDGIRWKFEDNDV
jgi:hypothetical protein